MLSQQAPRQVGVESSNGPRPQLTHLRIESKHFIIFLFNRIVIIPPATRDHLKQKDRQRVTTTTSIINIVSTTTFRAPIGGPIGELSRALTRRTNAADAFASPVNPACTGATTTNETQDKTEEMNTQSLLGHNKDEQIGRSPRPPTAATRVRTSDCRRRRGRCRCRAHRRPTSAHSSRYRIGGK